MCSYLADSFCIEDNCMTLHVEHVLHIREKAVFPFQNKGHLRYQADVNKPCTSAKPMAYFA